MRQLDHRFNQKSVPRIHVPLGFFYPSFWFKVCKNYKIKILNHVQTLIECGYFYLCIYLKVSMMINFCIFLAFRVLERKENEKYVWFKLKYCTFSYPLLFVSCVNLHHNCMRLSFYLSSLFDFALVAVGTLECQINNRLFTAELQMWYVTSLKPSSVPCKVVKNMAKRFQWNSHDAASLRKWQWVRDNIIIE